MRNPYVLRQWLPVVDMLALVILAHGCEAVNSFDRSERILSAMKCRGFRGHFYVLRHFALSGRDLIFAMAATIVLITLILAEWI